MYQPYDQSREKAMTPINADEESELLVRKIRFYLISLFGRILEEATSDEFYRAFCFAIREQIMLNWESTAASWQQTNSRMIYYLSMEFLPGRFLNNNILNLKNNEVFARALYKAQRSFKDLLQHEADPGLGNGGLGRLASCYLDSMATLQIPSRGYGLRYQYGLFEQQLWDGIQIEKPDCWLWNENPWEFRRDMRKVPVRFCGTPTKYTPPGQDYEANDLTNYDEVWAMPYDIPIIGYHTTDAFTVSTLRLWSTKESPKNFELQRYNAGHLDQAAENTTLTDVLYPSDQHEIGKRIRLKQEFLLVSASLQDIFRHFFLTNNDIALFKEKVRIQINDTHPALLIAELMRMLTRRFGMTWNIAWETTRACTSYTNHTILSEALEVWEQGLMRYLLPRQYTIIEYINQEFCSSVRAAFPNDEEKVKRMSILENNQVRMAHLAIAGSHVVNGVAQLHTDILREKVFADFNILRPNTFINITNGVTPRRWLQFCNPQLTQLITDTIGTGWIQNSIELKQLSAHASNPEVQERFLAIKTACKTQLLDMLNRDELPRDECGRYLPSTLCATTSFLFDIQVKRIHEYKRQLLNALHIVMSIHDILDDPAVPRVPKLSIFAGKAAASYDMAKTIIRVITSLAKTVNRHPIVSQYLNIAYIENYNVSKAEIIIPAADLSEQISTAGMEASGTSNMKFALNGALTIGTEDGANIEMEQEVSDTWWPFRFGASAQEIVSLRTTGYSPLAIYQQNPRIKRALDSLIDKSFASNENEHQALCSIYHSLLDGPNADRFFVLHDLAAYHETQQKASLLYTTPNVWAEYAIHNIAAMGKFSSDRAIAEYAKNIWEIEPVPLSQELYMKIKNSYQQSQAHCVGMT